MKVDELQTFIENNLYADVPKETYNEIMGDAESMDLYSFNEKWGQYLNENSDGWTTMKKDFKSLPERLTNAFGSDDKKNPFNRSKNELDEIYKKEFSDDVSREQFDNALQQQSNYWEDFKKEREREAGITRRTKEVQNWSKQPGGWYRNLLSSEYEKQRYINEPEQAIFGKEAPMLGDAPETRWGAMGDLGMGTAAVAADVLTTPTKITPVGFAVNAALGPSIRAARDVAHKVTDSPYQKEGSDIFKDLYKDAALNAGTMAFANARRLARGTNVALDGKNLTQTILEDTYNIDKGTKELTTMLEQGRPYSEILGYIDDMPASPLKNDLSKLIEGAKTHGTKLDKNIFNETLTDYKEALKPSTQAQARELLAQGEMVDNPYLFNVAKSKAPTKMDKFAYKANKLAKDINAGKIGTIGVESLSTAGGARMGKAQRDIEYDKNWYKQNYTRDWLLGFRPYKKDQENNTPKWQAYKEWYFDKYGEMPKEDF